MPTNTLAQVMRSVAMRMQADFQASTTILHRGGAGSSRESIVRDFVARYLPGHVRLVHGGAVVTVSGNVSPQCDLLIVDRGTPPLLDTEDHQIVPSECVYGVIEVKTKLDGRELADACEKIRKVKVLPKSAYHPDPFGLTRTIYGQTYSYVPTAGMIFAFDSIELPVLAEHFRNWCASRPVEERPDSIWVLGKGFIVWSNLTTAWLTRGPNRALGSWPSDRSRTRTSCCRSCSS